MTSPAQKRLDEAKARLKRVQDSVTPEELAERQIREEALRVEAEAEAAERGITRDKLDQRIEAYRASHPRDMIDGLTVQSFPDAFIIRRDGKAHARWLEGVQRISLAKARGKTGDDSATNARKYAVALVIDWNGINDFDVNADSTFRLDLYLTEHPGLVTSITECGGRLAGVYSEERSKSGE